MDISPSHSNGSLVSMDESMSTSDTVRTPEVEYIDEHELAAVDSIEKKVCSTLYISEHVKAKGEQGQLPALVLSMKAYASRGYIAVAIDSRNDGHQYDNISSPADASDAKPCKVGTLPTYNISFKCDERAEKRKESMMDVVNNIVVWLGFGNGVHQLPEVVAGIPNGMPHASSSNEELERSFQSTVVLTDSETVGSSVQEVNNETTMLVLFPR
ncbi:hypothetical protein RDI58_000825 [Solanum bulbocastanum]|uniref:Uncharacterized protein n=1 Tax=Solanum bulbocastanum TaxID=147425 RepID=A0AAN8YPJ3_SOLBU